jgi:hypothetical protein
MKTNLTAPEGETAPMSAALERKNEICDRSNARKCANVEAFWQVLGDMKKKGVRVFTVAIVGRECEASGVLKTQTIRNAGGEDYRVLIEAFAREIGASTTNTAANRSTPLEEAIDEIVDLDVRTRLNMLVAENRRQREEINRMKQAFKNMRAQPWTSSIREKVEILPPPAIRLDIAPLEKFLSQGWIDERRWETKENGAIYDEDGDRVAPVGFLQALRQTIRAFSQSC